MSDYLKVFKTILPPWLLRTEGTKLIGGIADVIDDHRDRLVAGVKLRFPGLYTLEGIDRIGKERRLRRGPAETAEVFAERLPRWWEDHRTRGNAYALLNQMLAYFTGTLGPPYDCVSYRGLRYAMDANGDITRDSITWGTDESGNWANVWIILYNSAGLPDPITADEYSSIIKDWIPAHVFGYLVVIYTKTGTRLWDYPQPVPNWVDTWDWDNSPLVEELQ